jgi:hypothetical protein
MVSYMKSSLRLLAASSTTFVALSIGAAPAFSAPPLPVMKPYPVLHGICGDDYHLVDVGVSRRTKEGYTEVSQEDLHLRDHETFERIEIKEELYDGSNGQWGISPNELKIKYYSAHDKKRDRIIHIQPVETVYALGTQLNYLFFVYDNPANPAPLKKGICSNWKGDESPEKYKGYSAELNKRFEKENKSPGKSSQ